MVDINTNFIFGIVYLVLAINQMINLKLFVTNEETNEDVKKYLKYKPVSIIVLLVSFLILAIVYFKQYINDLKNN